MPDTTRSETNDTAAFLRAAVIIVVLCFALRVIDVFIIRSDEWFGEQVVTKVLGLAIVIAYAIWSGRGLDLMGFAKPPLLP